MKEFHLSLSVNRPFDWDYLYLFLKNHRAGGVESFSEGKYCRNFWMDKELGAWEFGFDESLHQMRGKVWLESEAGLERTLKRIRKVLDLDHEPSSLPTDTAISDPILNILLQEYGIRIPGSFSPFETAVSIILGQLVSVEQAQVKVSKLVQAYGTPMVHPIIPGLDFLFPKPENLIHASMENLGITQIRRQAIREISRRVYNGEIDFENIHSLSEVKKQLKSIPGIGDWTVEMIALRCLGDLTAFPKTDLILKRALEQFNMVNRNWGNKNAYLSLALWKRYALSLSKKTNKNL